MSNILKIPDHKTIHNMSPLQRLVYLIAEYLDGIRLGFLWMTWHFEAVNRRFLYSTKIPCRFCQEEDLKAMVLKPPVVPENTLLFDRHIHQDSGGQIQNDNEI